MKNKMDLHQHSDNSIVDFSIFLAISFIASGIWQEVFDQSIHAIIVLIISLLSAFLGYMAKNFWFPYLFPKDGKWKAFNFLRPKKN